MNNNNGIYIMSVEASDLFKHNFRGHFLNKEFVGYVPQSLELRKLKTMDEFTTFTSKRHPIKTFSADIINVKFDQKVRSSAEMIEGYEGEINELLDYVDYFAIPEDIEDEYGNVVEDNKEFTLSVDDEEYIEKLNNKIISLKLKEDEEGFEAYSSKELRTKIYKDGFIVKDYDFKTGELVAETKYSYYKRSGSKSRQGMAWFIKDELYRDMIKWSRMGIEFKEGEQVDLPSLQAYESLITSSCKDFININPESILMVDDKVSSFSETSNVIKKVSGEIDSVETENYMINNEVFDGAALIESELCEGKGKMLLLRSHFMKAAAFSANIQLFLKDYAEENGIDFDTWKIDDMFGNKIKASSIRMIMNPSCLKALKFSKCISDKSDKIDQQNDMWQHWKSVVNADENVFGICKTEKPTTHKYGYTQGVPLHQTSYQILNSLEASKEQVESLVDYYERGYIMDLKNKDEKFIEHLEKEKNDMNSNQMFIDLYKRNKNIVGTKMFREYRSKTISNYVSHVKKGKIRIPGQYVTMLSNPIEYLYHAVGERFDKSLTLQGNQIHTTLFGEDGFNRKYTGFRSPHSGQSNVFVGENVNNDLIEKYIDLSDNIVVVSAFEHNIMEKLNGCDWDSDTMLLVDHPTILELGEKCYNNYNVNVNGLSADPTIYHYSLDDMAVSDNKLSDAQTQIGEVTNLGQLALSKLAHKKNKGQYDEEAKQLQKYVDLLGVLSGVSIDGVKRQYDVNIDAEVRRIRKDIDLLTKENDKGEKVGCKPNFWKYVHNDKHGKSKQPREHYKCPMDYLYNIMTSLKPANGNKHVELLTLLNKKDNRQANRRQKNKVSPIADEFQRKIATINTAGGNEDELHNRLEDVTEEYHNLFGRLKINENTMFAILKMISDDAENKEKEGKKKSNLRLMNLMFKSQPKRFIEAFKEQN
ncbi:hypothetical protein [Halobacillus sp. A5]|uniref:hypothetical protein n=1 Tax=Halobacillus sp. A5 TaxID=2880263 RepID=UPI0020A6BDE5|nr:hypothetical protein [Halobacillus sp. A5]MCP3025401.1 hypothetical protein [Halobacillus sp. A5]